LTGPFAVNIKIDSITPGKWGSRQVAVPSNFTALAAAAIQSANHHNLQIIILRIYLFPSSHLARGVYI
jgi:hypothetical protein